MAADSQGECGCHSTYHLPHSQHPAGGCGLHLLDEIHGLVLQAVALAQTDGRQGQHEQSCGPVGNEGVTQRFQNLHGRHTGYQTRYQAGYDDGCHGVKLQNEAHNNHQNANQFQQFHCFFLLK